jgi:PAS domain S-box-containing protein
LQTPRQKESELVTEPAEGETSSEVEIDEPPAVLLVDDRPENLSALESVLATEGYRLVTALSGKDALRHLLKEEFAAMLLDLEMPDMDGIEVAKLVKSRERTRHLPILFVTASNYRGNEALRAYAQGAVDFMVKPVDPMVVRAKVAVFADLFRKRRQLLRMAARLQLQEQREAEARLNEQKQLSEARYYHLAESMPAIVWLTDAEGNNTYLNQTWTNFSGLSNTESFGDGWLQAVHPDDRERVKAQWREVVAEGKPYQSELRFRNKDGVYRWHQVRATPEKAIFGNGGKQLGWVGTATDVEDLKRAEEIQQRALDQMQQSLRARDAFLSVASHELKTPLTSVELAAQALERAVRPLLKPETPAPRLQKGLDVLHRQVFRMARMIDELLDVSQITAGRLKLVREDVDLVELVRQCVGDHADQFEQAGCALELDLPDVLVGRWDGKRVAQVILNLLANASKYGEGSPVKIELKKVEQWAELRVSDRGIGISTEDQSRIFDRFERAVSERQYGGFGLGLWISRQIVNAHGGLIRVESQRGKGSTFIVELPL